MYCVLGRFDFSNGFPSASVDAKPHTGSLEIFSGSRNPSNWPRAMYRHRSGVRIRNVSRSDLQDLTDCRTAGSWGFHTHFLNSPEDQQAWFEDASGRWFTLLVEGRVAGLLGADPIRSPGLSQPGGGCRRVSVVGSRWATRDGWTVPAAEACLDFLFGDLGVRRIEGEVMAYNRPALKLYLGPLGMVREGVRRKAVYRHGRYHDSILVALLRDEWAASERVSAGEWGEAGPLARLCEGAPS